MSNKKCRKAARSFAKRSFSDYLILTMSKFQIMKKIYITPETMVVAVNVQHNILDPSQIEVPIGGGEVGPDDPNLVKGRGRVGDVWADDWSK